MKKLVSMLMVVLVATMMMFTQSAFASDVASGAKVFSANCAACHAGGMNAVNPAKTLQKADLEKYAMNSVDAIKTQITNGKNAMPAFGGRLSVDDIENVATYVLETSGAGWK